MNLKVQTKVTETEKLLQMWSPIKMMNQNISFPCSTQERLKHSN